ncbi:hypothetical protein ALC53_11330 [Atta colombica]|uniref:Uncharacterized protein n=1 Tax=Atta colombica TaxID=520822 RepID=A0A151HZF7_9HYME|nr:hypothetical protein ALC53_11330 [Atta colombica]
MGCMPRSSFMPPRPAADNNTAQLLRRCPSSRKKGNKISIKARAAKWRLRHGGPFNEKWTGGEQRRRRRRWPLN